MAKIPDYTSLDQPIVSPARPDANVSRDALAAPGRAMAGFGQDVKQLGVALQAQQEEADDYETRKRFVDFDLQQEKALDEAKRNVGPEAKNFTNQYMAGYHTNAQNFFKDVPESQRAKYDYQLVQRGAAYEKRANDYELAERDKYHLQDIDTQTQTLRFSTTEKPASYKENLARGVYLIDGSRLPPEQKMKLRKQFAEGIEEDAIRARIGNGEDPETVINDIKRVPRKDDVQSGPVRSGRDLSNFVTISPSLMSGDKDRNIDTLNVPFTSALGAAFEAMPPELRDAVQIEQASRSRGYQAKLRSDYVNGRGPLAAPPGSSRHETGNAIDLGPASGSEKDPKFQEALKWLYANGERYGIENPESIRNKDSGHFQFTGVVPPSGNEVRVAQNGIPGQPDNAAPAGLSEAGNIDLKNRPRVVNDDGTTSTIRSISINEDGKEVLIPTVSDDGRLLSDADATALYQKTGKHLGKFDSADNATAYAKRLHDDQEALIDSDEGTTPYRHLSPEKRRTLITVAREAGRATVVDDITNDIAQIRRTGAPKAGADGRTSLDRGKALLTPRQLQKATEDWKEAELEYKTVAPLANMSEDEAHEHIGAMLPDDGDSDYATKVKVAKIADDRLKKIVTERKKDPALSVNATPEVREAFDLIKRAGQAQNAVDGGTVDARGMISPVRAHEMVIEARIAAQRRLGLSDSEISPITNKQISDLLQIPDPRLLSANDLTKKLKDASARAEEIYGPKYAKMAFEAATRSIAKNQQTRDLVSPIVRKMIVGDSVTPEDFKASEYLGRAALSDVLFDPTAQSVNPMTYSVPEAFPATKTEPGKSGFFSSTPDKTTGPFSTAKPAKAFKQAVPPEAIQMLLDNPGLHVQFDQKYGPGSAAAALKR